MSYKATDVSYRSVGPQKRLDVKKECIKEYRLCALHAKIKEERDKAYKIRNASTWKKGTKIHPLERKLNNLGVVMNLEVSKDKFRSSFEYMHEEEEYQNLTARELNFLTNSQLRQVISTFQKKIVSMENEILETKDENDRHEHDMKGLAKTRRRLQETVERRFRPWLNKIPSSLEMTRAMLVN